MEQDEYTLITRTIARTVGFLNRNHQLDKDDLDDIKNQTLLKLTPQLKKILNFEKLHLENFVRKTTRSVFWDYLKSTSADLTAYRIKKRIKTILYNLEETFSQFIRPDNDTLWYTNENRANPEKDRLPREIPPGEKQAELENIIREWKMKSTSTRKSLTGDESLSDLIKQIFKQIDFGVSVNDIFFSLTSTGDIEEMVRPIETSGTDINDDNRFYLTGVSLSDEISFEDFRVEERVYYENYAEEFLENYVTLDQTWVYYLRFVTNLSYKEIEKKFHINTKTAESRLSIKLDKKGFLWRLTQFIKNLELNIEECRNFLYVLDRKIGEMYSNRKIEATK